MDNTTQSSSISVPKDIFSSQNLWGVVEEGFTAPADTLALNAAKKIVE